MLHQIVLLHNSLDHARHLVGATARARGHDELDRFGRLPLSFGLARINHAERNAGGDQRRRKHEQTLRLA
jgi:hypothetical protein